MWLTLLPASLLLGYSDFPCHPVLHSLGKLLADFIEWPSFHTYRSFFIENPPITSPDAELVLEFGAPFGENLLPENVGAILAGRALHLERLPWRVRKGASDEEWRLGTGFLVGDCDRDHDRRHCGCSISVLSSTTDNKTEMIRKM